MYFLHKMGIFQPAMLVFGEGISYSKKGWVVQCHVGFQGCKSRNTPNNFQDTTRLTSGKWYGKSTKIGGGGGGGTFGISLPDEILKKWFS